MRRSEWIIGGILGLVLVAVLVFLLVYFLNGQPADQEAEVIDVNNLEYATAREAYDLAQPVARDWRGDAALLSASASWQPEVDFTDGRASWTFVFYSQEESATVMISVIDKKPRVVRTTALFERVQLGDANQWQVDSPEAISQLLVNGADDFMRLHAKVNLVLTLDVKGEPTWRSTFLDPQTKESYSLNITADTGEFTP